MYMCTTSSSKLNNLFLDEKCSFPVFYSSLNSSKCHKILAWAFRD
jgi:hypothetical protein